jgi:two-component system CheB/CheR fusion protein
VQEDGGYRIAPELRAFVVFTVQDVLSDPPFSRLDLISCRNLLIYLLPHAQAQVLAVFHFALRDGGVLLLGSAETVGNLAGRFEPISKADKLYRRIGPSRPGEIAFLRPAQDSTLTQATAGFQAGLSRQSSYADLGRRLVLQHFAPAAVLVTHDLECLFSLGPTDRFLRVAPGYPSHDLLGMARPGLRTKLHDAIKRALAQNAPVTVDGGRIIQDGSSDAFTVNVRPVHHAGEDLLLICFLAAAAPATKAPQPAVEGEANAAGIAAARITELEHELEGTRGELQGAIRDLATSTEDQKAINEEALSVNEEYQSTNEELLTSKEELQSLNEELIAVNAQLQETLERQRTTSSDLQNVLYSTDIATIFLDPALKIRFFTPATKLIFNIIPGDIGRKLGDLQSLIPDHDLQADIARVLRDEGAVEREVHAPSGKWFCRRAVPYLGHDEKHEGVVITFNDITERKAAALALEAAQRGSEAANAAKTRFLAAASHDLRQPLQTLTLLQGLLARTVEGARKKKLVDLLDETLGAMSGMLSTLLDINQIDAGIIHPEIAVIDLTALIEGLREEFTYHAEAQGLTFHVMVGKGVMVRSDARLLGQVLRNLVSNAFKYTRHGKILLGCRRRGQMVSIQVWDTGIGIADVEIQAIFEEYHQVDNPARERSRGLGLGLPIVQRLAKLLGHEIRVKSRPGRGSMFSIDVAAAEADPPASPMHTDQAEPIEAHRCGTILVVEDDPAVAKLLELFLNDEGHRVLIEADGVDALASLARAGGEPDLILSDYNLPNKLSGLQFAAAARKVLKRDVPVIILTGDISTGTVQHVTAQDCHYIVKPVKLDVLSASIQTLLPPTQLSFRPRAQPYDRAVPGAPPPVVFVIGDDRHIRDAICAVMREDGRDAVGFPDAETFMAQYTPGREGCLLVDASLPGMSGLGLIQTLHGMSDRLPIIMVTGHSDVHMAVEVMKAGAADFVEKPIAYPELLAIVDRALERSRDAAKLATWRDDAAGHINALTARQHQIMDLVLAGHPSKNIAADLNISQRTVENHRAAIMKRTGSASLPALARLAVTAALQATGDGAAPAVAREPDILV